MNGKKPKKKKGGPGQNPGGAAESDFPQNNPYNFIPFGPPVRLRPAPPSHKRFQGLSGTITLHLTNETPMMVARRVNPEDETPPKLENFKIDGQLALPGTALKGMLRSVLEAVTNACFVIFDGERLDYRMATQNALRLKAGRITRMPVDGQDGEIEEMDRAWIAMPGKPKGIKIKTKGVEKTITLAEAPKGARSGQEVWLQGCNVEEYYSNSRAAKGQNPWIKPLSGTFAMVEKIFLSQQPGCVAGVFKITEQSIDNKKRERVFAPKKGSPKYKFKQEEVDDYNQVLTGQLAEHQKRKDFDLTERKKLEKGALVYFEVAGGRAVRLSRVEIPRTRYNKSRADLLPQIFHKCTDPNSLCAACQLFGFVADVQSSRGRITIGDARWVSGKGEQSDFFPLKVLGEPHPTSYNFYLIDPQNPNQVRNYDGLPITDNRGKLGQPAGEVRLRGRKFYYHHPLKDWVVYHCPDPGQFRNVLNEVKPLQPGNTFEFNVSFRNLSDSELGLLIYCLILEENLRHKLGLARAVGFGTVKITCQSLNLHHGGDRYTSLDAHPQDKKRDITTYINVFKAAVPNGNPEGKGFEELGNVQKLKIMLDLAQAPADLSYPGFHWYMRHRNVPLPQL